MDAPTKTITLGDWLKGCTIINVANNPHYGYKATSIGFSGTGPTPEDALQALCEATCGEGTLLDLDRSERWIRECGPDMVAGLADGEAGVVVCKDGKLVLVDRLSMRTVANIADAATRRIGRGTITGPTPYTHTYRPGRNAEPDTPAGPCRNTFPTGLPVVYPDTLAAAETRPIETSLEEEAPDGS